MGKTFKGKREEPKKQEEPKTEEEPKKPETEPRIAIRLQQDAMIETLSVGLFNGIMELAEKKKKE